MDSEKRTGREEDDRTTGPSSHSSKGRRLSGSGQDSGASEESDNVYNLMVAGQRTGKTSFLRLLLDTCRISPTATKEQLASVAKFVQGCSGHTAHVRTAAIDAEVDLESGDPPQRLTLSLIDTPSLDFQDDVLSERLVSDMLRLIDSRLADGISDDWTGRTGDHYIHLCIYFLDPDHIVPPPVHGPPAPMVPRTRGNSFTQNEQEPVILEPPVTTNPLLCRPMLPLAEINTIRRLSARVNVLPVIARTDTLTNDRLAAVKVAVRRGLAEAGIGFGIFDVDTHLHFPHHIDALEYHTMNGDGVNGYSRHKKRSASPSTSPTAPALLRLPYALISPDVYAHSDGVGRPPLSRHELVRQYTPSSPNNSSSKLVRGQFTRSYRWGSMDVLNPNHCDFLALRTAIFQHMKTLQKYTREYLLDKFTAEYLHHHQLPPQHSLSRHHAQSVSNRSHLSTLSRASHSGQPVETASSHPAINRHPTLSISREREDFRSVSMGRARADSASIVNKATSSVARSSKQRSKKITVACNFCRSRKLKCDGGRPACSQCIKRSHHCDYMARKRRGTLVQFRSAEDSESESGEDRSAEQDEPSLSPEVPSLPLSRRSSNAEKLRVEMYSAPSPVPSERRDEPMISARARNIKTSSSTTSDEVRSSQFKDPDLPQIATLSVPETSAFPQIRPATEQQAAQRKRAATVSVKSNRQLSTTGPKVVACNFCRARKTKCDGVHPTCSSCARRCLPCNYVHDATAVNGQAQKKFARRASTSKIGSASLPPSPPPLPIEVPVTHESQGSRQSADENGSDLKRSYDDSENSPPQKKFKMNGESDGSQPQESTQVDGRSPSALAIP